MSGKRGDRRRRWWRRKLGAITDRTRTSKYHLLDFESTQTLFSMMKVSTPNYSEITLQKVFFTFNWNLYLAQQWVMRCITESQPLILNPKKCMVSVRLKVYPIIDQIGLWLLLQNSTIFDLVCCCKMLNWIWLDLVGVMCLKATGWDFKSSITSPNVSTLINPFYAVASVVKFWKK